MDATSRPVPSVNTPNTRLLEAICAHQINVILIALPNRSVTCARASVKYDEHARECWDLGEREREKVAREGLAACMAAGVAACLLTPSFYGAKNAATTCSSIVW